MSINLSKDKAEATAEFGVLSKLLAVLKKILTTEFIWVLLAVVLGLPLAILLDYVIEKNNITALENQMNKLTGFKNFFLSCYAFCIGGIYFSRAVVNSLVAFFKK